MQVCNAVKYLSKRHDFLYCIVNEVVHQCCSEFKVVFVVVYIDFVGSTYYMFFSDLTHSYLLFKIVLFLLTGRAVFIITPI